MGHEGSFLTMTTRSCGVKRRICKNAALMIAIRALCTMLILTGAAAAQDVIPLYQGTAPGSTQKNYPEKEYISKIFHFKIVTNVTRPSLTVFKPSPELKNGTAVVICPGGGFYWLSMKDEGS